MPNRWLMNHLVWGGLVLVLLSGCQQRLGDFTVLSTKNMDLTNFSTAEAESVSPVQGEDSKPIIFVSSTGQPNMNEATDRALESSGACMLTNAVIYQENWYIPYIYGDNKFIVKGNPVKR